LAVVPTELGTLGLAICADNFGSSLAIGHVLARMGAQVVLSPSAWAVDADHDNEREPYGQLWLDSYHELTRLYDVTIIGVSNVGWLTSGPWKGRKAIGCSLAVGPGGAVLARGPYGEQAEDLMLVDVEPRPEIGRGTTIAPVLEARGYRGP
jgi:predicted amidohydrolase